MSKMTSSGRALIVAALLLIHFYPVSAQHQLPPFSRAQPAPGSFSITPQGGASWSMDIEVPPGTSNVAPQLTLSYNSSYGNGLLGIGFELQGLSMINRVGATPAQDGFKGGVNYDQNDRFSLNGNRLIGMPGKSYGADGESYHTEKESWTRVISNGQNGSGPQTFEVTTKKGGQFEYGGTADSRVTAIGAPFNNTPLSGSCRAWLVNKYTDQNGNILTVTYTQAPPAAANGVPMTSCQGRGMAYPLRIDYTSGNGMQPLRSVQFFYEARPDTTACFLGGGGFITAARISAIRTYVKDNKGDSALVREVAIAYEPATPLEVSRVTSVTVNAKDCGLLPASFTWSAGQNGFRKPIVPFGGSNSNAGFVGDFNGDGKNDILQTTNYMYLGTDSGFHRTGLSGLAINASGNNFVGDFNGDGISDFLNITGSSATGGTIYYYNQTTDSFDRKQTVNGIQLVSGCGAGSCLLQGDFNGDGLADLVSLQNTNCYFNFGDTALGLRAGGSQSYMKIAAGKTFAADFNGDGLTDLFNYSGPTGYLSLSNLSDSTGFRAPITISNMSFFSSSTQQSVWIGDYNADGMADILALGGDGQYRIYSATGRGFAAPRIVSINLKATAIWPGDFNNDGAMDFYATSGNAGVIYLSDGINFNNQEATANFQPQYTWMGDFNGDGYPDLFNTQNSQMYYGGDTSAASHRYNQKGNLLTAIDNGDGSVIKVRYRPITDSTVYNPGPTSIMHGIEGRRMLNCFSAQPLAAVQSPSNSILPVHQALYVAASYTQSDGFGAKYLYHYKYAAARYDMSGYGFLGYAMMSATDINAGSVSRTWYKQVFPLTGNADSATLTDTKGTRYTASSTIWNSKPITYGGPGTTVYTVLQQASNNYIYSNGQLACNGFQQYWYDNYGNCRLRQNTGNKSTPQNTLWTRSSYANDTSHWYLGYLTGAAQSTDSAGKNILSAVKVKYDPHMHADSAQKWNSTNNSWLTQSFIYDAFGNQTCKVSYSGDSSFVQYDGLYHSFPVRSTSPPDAQGIRLQTLTQSEPFYGNQVKYTDANGNVSGAVYDWLGRLWASSVPDSAGKQFVAGRTIYYPGSNGKGYSSQQIIYRDWAGKVTDTVWQYYDGTGRLRQRTSYGWNNKKVIEQIRYDTAGRIGAVSQPYFAGNQPAWSRSRYDAAGRLIWRSTPYLNGDSTVTRIDYGPLQLRVTSAAGTSDSGTAVYAYNFYNGSPRITALTNKMGAHSSFSWDALGRAITGTDPQGIQTATHWNSLNMNDWYYSPSFDTTHFYYAPVTRQIAKIDAMRDTLLYNYDKLGRVLSIKGTATTPVQFTYDAPGYKNPLGNLCSIVQDNGATSYGYDHDCTGNITGASVAMDGYKWTERTAYNPDQTVQGILFPDSTTERFKYSAAGQPVSIQRIAGKMAEYVLRTSSIDAMNNWQQYAYGNGVVTEKSYYGSGALNTIQVIGSSSIISKTYNWNRNGQITGITDLLNSQQSGQYHYNAIGRLLAASTPAYTDTFAYDLSGNLLLKDSLLFTYNGYQPISGKAKGKQLYAATYDDCGRMLTRTLNGKKSGNNFRYAYNGYGLMDSVYRNDTLQYVFSYDYTGTRNRVRDMVNGSTSYFVTDNYNDEITPNGHTGVSGYSLGGMMFANFSTAGKPAYYSYDQNGSTILITDQYGKPRSNLSYRAYGSSASDTGRYASAIPYKFNGRTQDQRSGLYYFSSRYYDVVSGRFTSPDDQLGGMLATPDALNNYAFVLNSPITLSDPGGHAPTGTITDVLVTGAVLATEAVVAVTTDGAAVPEEIVADEMIVSGSSAVTDGVDAAGTAVADAVETNVSAPATSAQPSGQSANKILGKKMSRADREISASPADDGNRVRKKRYQGNYTGTDNDRDNDLDQMFKPTELDKSGRPSFRGMTVLDVWESAMDSKREVYCEGSGRRLTFYNLDKTRAWDMGHLPGYEYRYLKKAFLEGRISREEFLNEYNDATHYRPEDPTYNRSHQGESNKSQYQFDQKGKKKTSFVPWFNMPQHSHTIHLGLPAAAYHHSWAAAA